MTQRTNDPSANAADCVTLEQFMINASVGDRRPVLFSHRPDFDLRGAATSVVGDPGRASRSVWVLLDVDENNHHVLVDSATDPVAALTASINQLTRVRHQLERLRSLNASSA